MKKISLYVKAYWKIFLLFVLAMTLITIAFYLKIDKKAIAFFVIVFGFLTQLFTEILGLVALVPILGPIIVKLLTLPVIIIINGIGYLVTFFAFKKGYKIEVAKSKLFSTALLTGIIIGYIIGKLL